MYPQQPGMYPQQPQMVPGAGGYSTPQMPFDPNTADYWIQILNRMLTERNYDQNFRAFFQNLMNWRAGVQSTVGNVQRFCTEIQQRLMQMGVNLNQSVPEAFIRQAIEPYLTQRVPLVTQAWQASLQRQQQQTMYPQQQMYGQPNVMGAYGQPQMMGYPQQQQYPAVPGNVMGSMGLNGGMQAYSPVVDYDPIPEVSMPAQQQTVDQNGAPVQQPGGYTQPPISMQPVADPAQGVVESFTQAANFDQATVPPAPMPPVPMAPVVQEDYEQLMRFDFDLDEVSAEVAPYVDYDKVDVSKVLTGVVGDVPVQSSIVTVRESCNHMDEAVNAVDSSLPDDFTEGEFLQVIKFGQLLKLDIPTVIFDEIRQKVLLEYREKNGDWLALLSVMSDTKTRHSQVLDAFLVEQINRLLCRYFRTEESLGTLIKVRSLWDLRDLSAGKFNGPLKDQTDWKKRLDKIMGQVIKYFFEDINLVRPGDKNKSDIIRCDQVDLIHNGTTKFDLAFVDDATKEAYIKALLDNSTILKIGRLVGITNMIDPGSAKEADVHLQPSSNKSQRLFFKTRSELDKHHGIQHIDCLYLVRGNSLDLSPSNLLAGKMMLYPYARSGGVGPDGRRPHIVDPVLCYGTR